MHLKRMIVILAAAASLSIAQAVPAYAASAAPGTHAPAAHALAIHFTVSTGHRRGLQKSRSVDPKTGGGCGEFKGTLYYYSELIGGNSEQTYDVVGTLYRHCSGDYTRLYADYTCDDYTPQGPRIGERTTKGSNGINWGSPECSYGITHMRVQICFKSSTIFGCAYSDYL
jgi:hypothetical protein